MSLGIVVRWSLIWPNKSFSQWYTILDASYYSEMSLCIVVRGRLISPSNSISQWLCAGWCRHHGRSTEKVMAVSKCYAHTRKYTNTQMHKYTNMAVSKYYAHSRKYTNAQIHEYTNTRIHTFTNVVLSNKFKFNRKKYICNLPNKYACQYLKQIYL